MKWLTGKVTKLEQREYEMAYRKGYKAGENTNICTILNYFRKKFLLLKNLKFSKSVLQKVLYLHVLLLVLILWSVVKP